MIASRRTPSAHGPKASTDPESGPRCTIAAFIRSTSRVSGAVPGRARSPQIPHIAGSQGYAVVSCHAERPLDDAVWERYLALLERQPSGFRIASLMRPPQDGET